MRRRVVVVGYGMVGARFAEEVRRRDPDGTRVALTVLGMEDRPAYNRVLLSTVLAGGLTPQAVQMHDVGWAAEHRVDVRTGVAVIRIDRRRRVVHAADGTAVPYDDLVLATGSRAWLPPVVGLADPPRLAPGTTPTRARRYPDSRRPGPGVAVFRDLDDCARILDMARPGARLAVVGGGLLGLEAARGLAGRGVEVTLVHPCEHLMERQLDAGAGAVLAAVVGKLGIALRMGAGATAWAPGTGLTCDDGAMLDVDGVIVAAGVYAETGLAADAGIDVDRGVLVDDRLATSAPRVYAVGDCAQHAAAPAGLVQPGWEQAAVLADLLTDHDPAARYRGTRAVTRLKARDVDLAVVGDGLAGEDATDPETELLRFTDARRGRYASLALRDDLVVGGIVIGFPDAAATLIQLHDSGQPAPADRLALLFGRALPGEAAPTSDPGRLPAAAVVCRCNTVTKGALVSAWRAGATDAAALRRATRAGTGCGSCVDTVAGICDWLAGADPDPPAALVGVPGGHEEEGAA
ncbi:FAD-dependent oxidoreductase [Pseudonocardia asaccharolytica]|uniref:FAD/NAD(P)-binding oxidoreductase n=1 Tax=Pseudonocardia asaccharolytica DSM 44247 = NBRC 16224 TaxID=1123024 RepID=A0A511CWY1_9PSEU|nr:FAD-dependent oxidoreductase [Pseudonocardia asaccharolytica]GEL16987.1 FAD/NAD(P)-binding oxidoreductase [Pseudonocardia asaccharolytica DSM 44247 = NBRC 16224]